MFTKVSICLFLLRITVTKQFKRPLQAAVVILVLSNIVLSLLWVLQCTPHLDKAWDSKLPGHCFSKGQLERIIIAQASRPSIPLMMDIAKCCSHFIHIGFLPICFSHPHLAEGPDQFQEQSRSMLIDGTRSRVSSSWTACRRHTLCTYKANLLVS